MEITITTLECLTGFAYKTIKKRLSEQPPVRTKGLEIFYESARALSTIYCGAKTAGIDLGQERARLTRAQANKTELEVEKMRDNLVDVNEWLDEFTKVIDSLKNKLQNMALKISDNVSGKTREETYELINVHAHAILLEIANEAQKLRTDEPKSAPIEPHVPA